MDRKNGIKFPAKTPQKCAGAHLCAGSETMQVTIIVAANVTKIVIHATRDALSILSSGVELRQVTLLEE